MLPVMDWRMFWGVVQGIHCRSSVCDTGLADEGSGNRETDH